MEETPSTTPSPPPETCDTSQDNDLLESPMMSPDISPAASPLPPCENEHMCKICDDKFTQPCILGCLHVFCAECLEKRVEVIERDDEADSIEDGHQEKAPEAGLIVCPECKQETTVGSKGVEGLPQDHVLVNLMDMVAIQEKQIICTSCKAKEKAVARCSDCANFLCPNCVTAHQYMRCFENHKVVSFEELNNAEGGMSLHKPLFCSAHASETMKYFCNTCQVPICNECMVSSHKQPDHSYERISDEDCKHADELTAMVKEAENKVDVCMQSSAALDGSLRELQMQRDNARGLIQETFQSYKALLEKRQEAILEQLEEIHSSQELSIMEMFHTVEKTMEKIEDGCKFIDRVLKHGNNVEVMSLKKLMSAQMLSLINNTPKPEVDVKIDFTTDAEAFEEAIKQHYGHFVKHEKVPITDTPGTSLHSSFENEGIKLPSGVLDPDHVTLDNVAQSDFMVALPSVPSMVASVTANLMGVSQQTINSIASSIQNLTASAERSSSRNSYSPAMSDSGISVDAASNSSGSNLANLAKLGSVSVNNQGQITFNGTVIPGLTVNNVGTLPPSVTTNRAQTPTTPASEPCLANILGNITLNPPTPLGTPILSANGNSTRSQTPHLSEIAGILSQASPPLGGLGGLTGASGPSVTLGGLMSQSAISPVSSIVSQPSPGFGTAQPPPFPVRSNKMNAMQIRCKFGQLGPGKGQFNSPHGFCLGFDEDIIVADTNNHRIQVFEKTGEFKYQFGIPGREEGQLWYPRKVAVIRHSGKYVVCDRGNERSRMQIFTKNGHFIKKIAIRYIDIVAGLAVTPQGHIVAVDSVSPTVFVIGESGDLIKWFDCSDYMREPSDIAVDSKDYFVCDFKGHCVVVFNEDGQFVRRIGCENITNYPNGIDISDAGDVLVGDSHGNRFHVAVFQRDGSLIGEFECPYVKVSRCCGLKITMEGYVVTLAKNNHHVLVLNTLYIT